MANEPKIVYRVRGKKGTWNKVFNTLELAMQYRDHIKRQYDKSAKAYKVTETWEEVND